MNQNIIFFPSFKKKEKKKLDSEKNTMMPFLIFMLFLGMFMIVSGIYEQKFKRMEKLVRTEYRFIPRSMYEDAMATPDLTALYNSTFDLDDPWYNRTAQDTVGLTWYDKNVWDPKNSAYIRNPSIVNGRIASMDTAKSATTTSTSTVT
jgi:hypothetical protein